MLNVTKFIEEMDRRILAEGNDKVLLETVQHFSAIDNLNNLIDATINQTLGNLVEKSYLHPNGFDKMVLISGEHFNLRLHNFHPRSVMKPAESIHNHKWEFASSVLSGGYTAQEFDVHEGDIDKYHYRYAKGEGIKYVSPDKVSLTKEYQVAPGHSYFMPSDVFHSIRRINDGGCVTVMMTGFTNETTTSVFTDNELAPGEGNIHCGMKQYTAEELTQTLLSIKDKLNA